MRNKHQLEAARKVIGEAGRPGYDSERGHRIVSDTILDLEEDQIAEIWRLVSTRLEISTDEVLIGHLVATFCTWWHRMSSAGRNRVEGMIVRSIRKGRCDAEAPGVGTGLLGTKSGDIFQSMEQGSKEALQKEVRAKLESPTLPRVRYLLDHVFPWIPDLVGEPVGWLRLSAEAEWRDIDEAYYQKMREFLSLRPGRWARRVWLEFAKEAVDSGKAILSRP